MCTHLKSSAAALLLRPQEPAVLKRQHYRLSIWKMVKITILIMTQEPAVLIAFSPLAHPPPPLDGIHPLIPPKNVGNFRAFLAPPGTHYIPMRHQGSRGDNSLGTLWAGITQRILEHSLHWRSAPTSLNMLFAFFCP